MLAVLCFPMRDEEKGGDWRRVSGVFFFLCRTKGREETGDVLAVLFFPMRDEEKGGDWRGVSGDIFSHEGRREGRRLETC